MINGFLATADCFFQPLLTLSNKGYRVIAVQSPPHFTHEAWCKGFEAFLRALLGSNFRVHLFGASLGGYLCMQFAHRYPATVASLALNNGYCDNERFKQGSTCLSMFRWLPAFYLKKYMLDSLPKTTFHPDAVDFVVEQLETLSKEEVSARLTLTCLHAEIGRIQLPQERMSFIDCMDESSMPEELRQQLLERFPGASEMLMKDGGDFPFLANPQEFCMLLQVHLRRNGLFPSLELTDEEVFQARRRLLEPPKQDSGLEDSLMEHKESEAPHFFGRQQQQDQESAAGVSISVVRGADADTVVIGGGDDDTTVGSDADDLAWLY